MLDSQPKNPGLEFLQKFQPTKSMSIEKILMGYAEYILTEADAYRFPVDLVQVFRYFGLAVHHAELPMQRGLVLPTLDIVVNTNDPKGVQLYSQAHELVEILITAIFDDTPAWISDEQIEDLAEDKENWCELGAAHILMPMSYFLSLIREQSPSIELAQTKASESSLSLIPVLRRMVECSSERKCAVILWKYDHKPTDNADQLRLWKDMNPEKKLRVYRSYKSPSMRDHIFKDKSIEADGVIGRAYLRNTNQIERGNEYLEVTKLSGRYYVEALGTPRVDNFDVISLIFFD